MKSRFFNILKIVSKLSIESLRFSLFFLILFLIRCAMAPIVYHEDLPAYSPEWGFPEIRFGMHQKHWYKDAKWYPGRYANLGIRTGQRLKGFAFEEGLASYTFTNKLMFGLQAGIGLKNGLIMIGGSWFPLNIYTYPVTVEFKTKDPWWQISLLSGTEYRPKGFGWFSGGCASNYGIGPFVGAELGQDIVSFRTEASATFKSFWAPERVKGQVYTIGFSAAYHGKSKVGR
ncbi:MAG: hypothetical protein OEZ20_10545 [candidate division WOR-3 bacterium]|nr:hypothetical protein [candidate division WOR-3 bacterium]